LTDSQKEVNTERHAIKSYLSERLGSDDQILSKLPGIVSKLIAEVESSEDEKSIEQWCKAIISFRTGEIKARVDAVYLNSLSDNISNGSSDTSDEELQQRKAALQAEMEELHMEIASVAEMVVEHELRKPMNEMKERQDRDMTQARTAWLNYVCTGQPFHCTRLMTADSLDTRLHGQTSWSGHD
jgi:signal recognition particle GTPase